MAHGLGRGRFCPNDTGLLLQQVEACHALGPYDTNPRVSERPPLALIVPHGALGHAGPVTAQAFALLECWSRQTGVFPDEDRWVRLRRSRPCRRRSKAAPPSTAGFQRRQSALWPAGVR